MRRSTPIDHIVGIRQFRELPVILLNRMNKLFKFSKLSSTYKVFYEVFSKSQYRQQSMMRPLFSLPEAGEFGDTS